MAKKETVTPVTNETPVVNLDANTNNAPSTDTTAADGEKPADVPKPEATSDELAKIRAEIAEHMPKLQALAVDVTKPEFMEATMKLLKLQSAETAEIANIAKHQKDLELLEKRNARVAWIDELLGAYDANKAALGNDTMSLEEKNAVYAKYTNIREKIANELLKTVGGSTPSKSVATGTTASGNAKGGITAAIRELIIPMYAAGKSGKDVRQEIIKTHGFNDGTANAVIKAYEVEQGIK